MNQIRLFVGACLCALLGCTDDAAVAPTLTRPTETVAGNTTTGNPQDKPLHFVETFVFAETGGITVLALLLKSEVDEYVESVIKSPENLRAAIEILDQDPSMADETLTVEWIDANVRLRPVGSGIIGIGIRSTSGRESEAAAIVNAVAASFCEREPERSAMEVKRLRTIARQNQEKTPNEEMAMAIQLMNQVFESEPFAELPTIVSKAAVDDR